MLNKVTVQLFTDLTTLWHAGGLEHVSNRRRPMWSGFMQATCTGEHPPMSVVRMLPILDLSPSDMNCVYSTLLFVQKQAKQLGLMKPCITFDQPLFIKAVDIVRHNQLCMTVRLGAFHTLVIRSDHFVSQPRHQLGRSF